MTESIITRRIGLNGLPPEEVRRVLDRQWLVTNGLGGYASGTISGRVTWRYHGLLVAALPAPFGRYVMLNHLQVRVHLPSGNTVHLSGEDETEDDAPAGLESHLRDFRLENSLPVWTYEVEDLSLEKYVVMPQGQNTTHIGFRLLAASGMVTLELRPSLHFRAHEQSVDEHGPGAYTLSVAGGRYEISVPGDLPALKMYLHGESPAFNYTGDARREIIYRSEAERGYTSRGQLWSPGVFQVQLHPGKTATLVASAEPWHVILSLDPREVVQFHHDRRRRLLREAPRVLQDGPAAELVLAADQFLIKPAGRLQDSARAAAAGDEIRSVIAGYHWFTDWGRDTMISLEGLTITTNRLAEAGWILRTFGHYLRDGLLPNLFPEGRHEGLYHTADATLWFFHALDRYETLSGDAGTVEGLLPRLTAVIDLHLRGTRFGIGVDPADGLLRQGAPGYQLTWMDAKVGDWVVTPRRGKAVEINGLWHNALCLLIGWLERFGSGAEAARYEEWANRARSSFNRRFWYDGGWLFDVVDGENGDDAACRPNQLLAFSLKHPVLEEARWKPVLSQVKERLLTPLGLRTLSREHPDYKAKYFGDLRARDAAYHQGTVWAWLIGPYIDAWLKVHPEDKAGARQLLQGFVQHLDEGCIGSINEIFDAEAPFTPRGCIAQAWSVAEVLRCWLKTA
jgi:predicted glycogen debranching enzyme